MPAISIQLNYLSNSIVLRNPMVKAAYQTDKKSERFRNKPDSAGLRCAKAIKALHNLSTANL